MPTADGESSLPFRPLASTLVRSIVAAAALCTIAVATAQGVVTWRSHRANFEAEVQSVAQINVPLLTISLREGELDAASEQMKAIADRPQIAYAVLQTVLGPEFESGDVRRRTDPRTVSLSISENEAWLGTLSVAPNVDYFRAELVWELALILGGFALLTALICWVVHIILRRQLQLPMQRVADFATSLTPAELTRPLTLERPGRPWRDEIDQLAAGFRLLQDDIRSHVEALDREVAQRTEELERANRRLEALARRDPLTSLANRRRFDHEKARAWDEMLEQRHPLSVLMIDVDFFKNYNDHFGHAAGDECLISIARLLAGTFDGHGELPARLGGEEFAVLLERVGLHDALMRAEAAREAVQKLRLPHPTSVHGSVTVSIGVCAVAPATLTLDSSGASSQGIVELLGRADQALYLAKAGGRNKVVGLRLAGEDAPVYAGDPHSTPQQREA